MNTMGHVQIVKEDGPMIRRTDWGISHADLMCEPVKVEYDFVKRRGFLYMADGDCCDMTGCILLFSRMDQDVERIDTISGDKPSTSYVLSNGNWRAFG